MSANPKVDRLLSRVEPGRRNAMRKILIAAAYTAPVVASFSLDSLAQVQPPFCGNQTCPPVQVPASSNWTLAALTGMLGLAGAYFMRGRRDR